MNLANLHFLEKKGLLHELKQTFFKKYSYYIYFESAPKRNPKNKSACLDELNRAVIKLPEPIKSGPNLNAIPVFKSVIS